MMVGDSARSLAASEKTSAFKNGVNNIFFSK